MSDQQQDAIAQSFLEICHELGCEPNTSLLECLRERGSVAKVSSIDDNEQFYAVTTILPFTNLDELDLSGLRLSSSEQWCALLEACSRCTGLSVLSLKGCAWGSLGAAAEEALARQLGACRLSVLDLSQNQLGDTFLSTFSRSKLLRQLDSLTVLDLSENVICDGGAATLAAVLAAAGLHCPLKQLDLSFNRLHDSSARALAGMMAAVPLLAMELEGNQISDAGGLAVGEAIKGSLCLQRLNLNHNRLGSSTLMAIADAIRLNAGSLQELAVAGTSGSEAGVAALLTAICKSKALRLLDIRGIPLASQAVDAVCRLLESSCPLVTLRLDVDSKEAAESIAQLLPNKSTLVHFMMGGNVPEHVLSFIAAALSAHTVNKVQAASRGSSPTVSPRQQRSRTPTQLLVEHQQLLSLPAVTSSPSSGTYRRRSTSPVQFRPPSPAYSRRSSSSSQVNTPMRALAFGSPGSGGKGTLSYRTPPTGSGGRAAVRTLSMQARRASVIDPQGLAGLAGGGAANKAAEVFKRHDMDSSEFLDAEEMMSALQELGMLEGMRPRQLGKFLTDAIKEADTDKDGLVSLEDFTKYYERLARHYAEASRQGRISARRKAPEPPLDAPSNESLKRAFRTYCRLPIGQGRQVGASAQQINAAQFTQLCKDAGIVEPSGPLSQCAIDIIFTRNKPPGSRRLPFKVFLTALAAVADEAGLSFAALTAALSGLELTVVQRRQSSSQQQEQLSHQDTAGSAGGDEPFRLAPRRHSSGTNCMHTRLTIRDLTDSRVGPCLSEHSRGPNRCASSNNTLTMSCDSGMQHMGLQGMSAAADAAGSGSSTPCSMRASAGAAVWGTRAASPSLTAPSGALTPVSAVESTADGRGDGRSSEAGTYRQLQQQDRLHAGGQQQQQQEQIKQQHQRRLHGTVSPRQPSGVQVLAEHDAVHNPLFEGEVEVSAGGAASQAQTISHRLLALEKKILQRTSAAGDKPNSSSKAAANTPPGVLEARMAEVDASVAGVHQQLSAVLVAQDELKGMLGQLMGTLQAAGLSSPRQASNKMQHLDKMVESLSCDVLGLKAQASEQGVGDIEGLQSQVAKLAQSTDKRQTRVETAIYQVAHQVDLLDARVKQEQQSTLRTLQALLSTSMSSCSQ